MTTPCRAAINQLPPYSLAEQPVADAGRIVQLAQNELGLSPSPRALEAAAAVTDLNRYPDVDHSGLRLAIADAHGLDVERILCGAGSMELMSMLALAYLEQGTEVVVSEFGYKFFQVQCALAGAGIVVVPEPDMQIDAAAIAAAVSDRTRLVFVVNPGNPTGARMAGGAVRNLRSALPERVMLILDGAYAELVTGEDFETGFDLVDEGANVVVLRTFSKAYGLAALRVGWLYGPAAVIDVLARMRAPNTITMPGLRAAEAAMRDREHVTGVVARVIELREALREKVLSLDLTANQSHANFLLVGCPADGPISAGVLYEGLKRKGIMTRPMHSYALTDHLRITIGTRDEMAILSAALDDLVQSG